MIWVATYDGYKYDALALGRTRKEAVETLMKEYRRQFPTFDRKRKDWEEEIYVRQMKAGDCEIS